jgi:Mannitol dehydrogenase C-terminal domain/Mannitol dehydrogenase Rossmann domain
MDSIIEALQKTKTYTVTEISDEGTHTTEVTNYRAINSKYNEAEVVEEIATADTVTCAVGPNILKFLAGPIAKGLDARKLDYPVAVIACENAIFATNKLRDFILEKVSSETKSNIDSKARFANSAVDRIVPHQDADAGLNVKIESFWEWCVEKPPFKGMQEPKVEAIHYVDDLEPYIERKLFTVNTGHATTAYFGTLAGKKYIYESLQDKTVHDKVRDVLNETADLIVSKHKISENEQKEYVEKIISRFSNPGLVDTVVRVGRQPLRFVLSLLGRDLKLLTAYIASSPAMSVSSHLLPSSLSLVAPSTISSTPLRLRSSSRTLKATTSLSSLPRFSRRTMPMLRHRRLLALRPAIRCTSTSLSVLRRSRVKLSRRRLDSRKTGGWVDLRYFQKHVDRLIPS